MVLQTIWFFLWGLLWAVYFMTDGFDLGLGSLLPFVARDEKDRRAVYRAMGPIWDGNEVWLIAAGGVTFAAFPTVYAVMFSSLYSPLMLILFALILRGVSFEFRSQVESAAWRRMWDAGTFVGSFLPAVLFGVAFANIFQGIPFDGNGVYRGSLLTLLNPYGLLGGLLFLLLFLEHGALWLAVKTDGPLHDRAVSTAKTLWPAVLVAAVLFLGASAAATDLYANYLGQPLLSLVILAAVAGLLGIRFFLRSGAAWKAWIASSLAIGSATFYGVIGLFPAVFPSSLDPAYSLTAHNASSSPLTLKIMLGVTLAFVPVVLAYQTWAYMLFRDTVHGEEEPDVHY
ncbi:MAG: cytochrome d ubiquinol oxidase subunit II [Deltaproteobacteria bacterium]|nr:cytochrome d ubiquinol oxidase subunit II [Deltaproteobacteria bacterium]